jgi:hypothetical protein
MERPRVTDASDGVNTFVPFSPLTWRRRVCKVEAAMKTAPFTARHGQQLRLLDVCALMLFVAILILPH